MSSSFLPWNRSSYEQTVFHEAGHLIVLEYFGDRAQRIELTFSNESWGGKVHSDPHAVDVATSNPFASANSVDSATHKIVTTAFAGSVSELKFLIGHYLRVPQHRQRTLGFSQIEQIFKVFVDDSIRCEDASFVSLLDSESWTSQIRVGAQIIDKVSEEIPIGKCFWESDLQLIKDSIGPSRTAMEFSSCFYESVRILEDRWGEVEAVADALRARPAMIERPFGPPVPVRIEE
jgi:hypothetical protein